MRKVAAKIRGSEPYVWLSVYIDDIPVGTIVADGTAVDFLQAIGVFIKGYNDEIQERRRKERRQ